MLRGFRLNQIRHLANKGHFDTVCVGAGPAGYVYAIKAAQNGLKTAVLDGRASGAPGGTCLNVGCIPSKSLLNNTHIYHTIKHDSASRGIVNTEAVAVDFDKLIEAKDKAVKGLTGGIEMLFKKNKVDYHKATGSFVDKNTIKVTPTDGSEAYEISADNIVIATGSEPTPFPGIEVDEERIVTNTGILSLKEIPKRLTIIGGGIIGLEMASVYERLGSEVTVVEFQNAIGAGMDGEVAKNIQKLLQKQGLNFKLGTKVLTGVRNGDVVDIEVENTKTGETEKLQSDVLLVAVGRRPYTQGLNFEAVGVEADNKGRIIIDSEFKTNIPNIRVIGDVTFGPMLAHKAEEEGVAVAEILTKGTGHVNYNNIPSVMYTHPEVAWVGQSEEQLKEQGIKFKTGKFPFIANSRAKTNQDTDGFVKFIADAETQRVLGVHIIGSNAGEMIAEAGLALEYGASTEDIYRVCHAHPTLSEAFKEAAMAVFDKPVNF